SLKKTSVAKLGGSRAGSLFGSYALRDAKQASRSTDNAAGDRRPSLVALIDTKCKINPDVREEAIATPEGSVVSGVSPKRNCRRPQLHPPQQPSSIALRTTLYNSISSPFREMDSWPCRQCRLHREPL
ncbi:hypothetical protein GOP47_0002313, partial [Adiantum capillus-veneris]